MKILKTVNCNNGLQGMIYVNEWKYARALIFGSSLNVAINSMWLERNQRIYVVAVRNHNSLLVFWLMLLLQELVGSYVVLGIFLLMFIYLDCDLTCESPCKAFELINNPLLRKNLYLYSLLVYNIFLQYLFLLLSFLFLFFKLICSVFGCNEPSHMTIYSISYFAFAVYKLIILLIDGITY